jgi:hypothetical protein
MIRVSTQARIYAPAVSGALRRAGHLREMSQALDGLRIVETVGYRVLALPAGVVRVEHTNSDLPSLVGYLRTLAAAGYTCALDDGALIVTGVAR